MIVTHQISTTIVCSNIGYTAPYWSVIVSISLLCTLLLLSNLAIYYFSRIVELLFSTLWWVTDKMVICFTFMDIQFIVQ